MFALSWLYLYGVGGAIYAGGSWICIRAGVLDLKDPRERQAFVLGTACLIGMATVHALLQFVLPFWS